MPGPDPSSPANLQQGAAQPQAGVIFGSGQMTALIRAHDWSSTPLGPISTWSPTLISTVNMLLSVRTPMQLLWGPRMVLLYNDAFAPFYADRHPFALGQPGAVFWQEVWHAVGGQLENVLNTGISYEFKEALLPIIRNGVLQDLYWNYTYSPIFEPDGTVGGVLNVSHEVTQQVLAERALRASEARALRILQSIGDAVIVTDSSGCIQRMNPVAEELTRWSQHDAQGLPLAQIFRIINETSRLPVESPIDKVIRLGTVVGLANHTILIARDGHETHIDDSGAPIRDDSGELTGMVLVFRNIDDRRATEVERDAISLRLNQALEATTDGILSIDRTWHVTYINPQATRIIGPAGDILGQHFWRFFPQAVFEGSPFTYHYYRAMDQGIPGEFESFYPEPLNIHVRVQVRPSPDGIVIFFGDVTTQKQAAFALEATQQSLARSESQLRIITDTLPTYIAYVDPNLVYLSVNRAYAEWLQRPVEAINGHSVRQVIGESGKNVVAHLQAALAGEHQHFETIIYTANGERTLSVTHIPDYDDQGKIRGVVVQGLDVTDRKRSEEALIQSEKLAAVGRLAASIAHEINNPLESVTNLIYLARTTEDHDTANHYLDTADRELRRAAAITNQTLRFHRQATKPTEVTAEELFDLVLSMQQGRLVNSNVEVQRLFHTDKPVCCFAGEIRQVLNNLIGNAVDAMHPIGGHLFLRAHEGTHWPTGRAGLILTIADTGPGMTPHTRARAFEAFYTTKDIGGTGLGLWISKEIVARHQGSLCLRTSQHPTHHGTVFTLFLPFDATIR